MLRFIRSDCTDRLADALIDTLAAQPLAPTPDALEPEWIVVPSAAVARYVQQRIARRFGIAADVQFTYPAATLWALAARVVPGIAAESPFDPSSLTWRIYALLDVLERGDASDAALAPLATYLDRTRDDPVARMQLAQALAELFDRYTTFRSDVWLAPWARGELAAGPQLDAPTQAWQAALWRHIVAGLGLGQAPHPLERFRAALARDPRVREALPRRVRLFAVHALAPLYWQTYAALAEAIDVEIYHREPSAEYYGDLLPERRIAALRAQANPLADVAESGNDVLASWGRQAIEQLDLAIATGAWDASEERHARRMGTSLLARVQRSVVELDPRPDLAPALDDAHDRSLVIHACTSLQRQLEALHDDLLARLDADPTLAPDDIAVFVPDIDAAAPMIDAVFGAMPAAIRLPYRMTGRAQPQADPLVAAFLALLDLPRARFSAEAVAALLRVPACARRFGLDADAVERVVALVADAGARWALDAHDRARHGVPAQGRHTWTYALERLVLGAALAPDVDQPVFDVQAPDAQAAAQPSAPLEGDALDALGGLIAFMRMAERLAHESTDARTPVQWAAWLGDAFANAFDAHDGDLPSAQRIRAALRRLADDAARGGCASTLPYAVARERLAHALAAQKPGAVPTGAITFASMGPLRAVPFRVVALLGLDDGAFPRPVVPLEFDLMARAPRIGDRDRRHDDRATLLDALLDAQDALILGCTVRDARDDTDRPPSVLVEELVDFIAAASDWPRDRVWARLAIEHALHGFGPVAFAPLAPASYVQPWRDAAACLAAPLHTRHARLLAPEPLPEDETSAASPIDAARLVGWLAHPARHFLRDRLRLALDDDARVLDDEEPFALSARDASALRWRIAEAFERGRSRDDAARVVMAGVELPAGRAGEVALRGLLDEASAWQRVHADTTHRLGEALPPRALECRIGARVVTATMHGLHGTNTAAPHALLISRPDVLGKGPQARVRVRIEAWIAHLLAQCAYGRVATLVAGIDHMFALAPCENAPALLGVLLDDYQRAQRSPLICPPKTAWRVARGESLDAAQRACWAPQDFGEGEADDPWWRMLLGDAWSRVPRAADFPGATSTFGDDDFATLVERLYVPMAQAIVETVKGVDEIVQQVLA